MQKCFATTALQFVINDILVVHNRQQHYNVANSLKNVSFEFLDRNQHFRKKNFAPSIEDLKPFLCREDNTDQT